MEKALKQDNGEWMETLKKSFEEGVCRSFEGGVPMRIVDMEGKEHDSSKADEFVGLVRDLAWREDGSVLVREVIEKIEESGNEIGDLGSLVFLGFVFGRAVRRLRGEERTGEVEKESKLLGVIREGYESDEAAVGVWKESETRVLLWVGKVVEIHIDSTRKWWKKVKEEDQELPKKIRMKLMEKEPDWGKWGREMEGRLWEPRTEGEFLALLGR